MSQQAPADRANREGATAGGSTAESEATDTLVNERAVGTGRGQLPAEWANAARQQATHALGSAASTIRQQAGTLPGGQPVQQVAQSVAGTLQSASQQLQGQGQSLSGLLSALEQQVRRQPLAAIGGAFLAGFIIGKLTD